MENFRFVGTSHVAEQSIKEVTKAFQDEKPDILALELDKRRFFALVSSQKGKEVGEKPRIRDVGFKGYLFFLFGHFIQKKIGEKLGISPGAEMKIAVEKAKEHKLKIALIDRDIQLTLQSLSKNITWKEKWTFLKDIVKGLFGFNEGLPRNIDLSKVPDDELVSQLLIVVKEKYPGMYRALVEERNEIMAKNLAVIRMKEPNAKVLVIIGAGHKQGLIEELERKLNNQIYIAG